MTDFSPDALRVRFHALCDQRDAIRKEAAPIRAAYDAKRQEVAAKEQAEITPLVAKLKTIEAPLFDLDQEIAAVARALGGKTGERPVATNG